MISLHTNSFSASLHRRMPLWRFSLLMSGVNMLLYNLPFFRFAAEHADATPLGQVWLLGSLAVAMLTANFLMCYLLVWLLRYVAVC